MIKSCLFFCVLLRFKIDNVELKNEEIVGNKEIGVVMDKVLVFEVSFDDKLCLKCVKDEFFLM